MKPPGADAYQTILDAEWTRVEHPRPLPAADGAIPPAPIDSTRFVGRGLKVRSFHKGATIAAPVASVYAAWTDGDTFATTYDPNRAELAANIDLEIGGRFEWLWDGRVGSNGCQILSFIPDRMVSFSWNAPESQPESRAARTWVVVEFTPTEQGTDVRLTHLGFGDAPHWDETYRYFQKAWDVVLSRFKNQLEGAAG